MADTTNPSLWPRWLERASRRWHLIAVGFALVLYASQLWTQKWISDDGYIYLTYVKNLFEHGELVYNLGERVDAATGFLWLLALIAGKAVFFFLDLRQVTFIVSWLFALLAFWVLARRVRAGEHRFLIAIALIFFTHFVISFSTSGLETPLILLLSVLVYELGRHHFRSPAMALMLGAAPFIRPELGILLLVYWACLLRRLDRRNLAISAGVLFFLSTARWLCFGDVLPNTAFIKLLSPTYGQGGRYFFEFFASYWYFGVMCAGFLAIGGWLLCRLACRKQLPESIGERHLFTIVSTCLLFGYVYASGGDFMHGRFFLTPFVFVTLLVVDVAPHLVPIPLVRWRPAAIPLLTGAAAIAAGLAIPYNLRADQHSYARISDEQAYWAATNPRLTAWSEPNPDPRAERGRRYQRLAGRVGRRVGVVAGAMGQVGYYRDSDRVYVFDMLSLTNAVGSMLHTQGYYRRIGHNVPLPAPLMYLEPRLTLFRPPDYKLSKKVQFEFEGDKFWVGALRDVDAYVGAGLLPADTWTRVDDRIRAILKSTWIDRNVVFYLRHRYPEDRPLFSRIQHAYDKYAADGARSWITWYERQKPLLDVARAIAHGERSALPARYRVFIETSSLKPIDTTYQGASWATRRQRRCPVVLRETTRTADPGVTVEWLTSDEGALLAMENGGERDPGWVHIDLQSEVRRQCGQQARHVILDWVVREVSGDPATHFFVTSFEKKQPFYRGAQLRIDLRADPKPLMLHFPLHPGQRYALSLNVIAVAPDP